MNSTVNPVFSMSVEEWFNLYGWQTFLFLFVVGVLVGYLLNEMFNKIDKVKYG